MPRRTQLFQQAGSPLIQGRSRSAASFWSEWVVASVGALAVVTAEMLMAVRLGLLLPAADSGPLSEVLSRWPHLVGATAASAFVVWFGGKMGWRRRPLAAAVAGVAVANVTVLLGAA